MHLFHPHAKLTDESWMEMGMGIYLDKAPECCVVSGWSSTRGMLSNQQACRDLHLQCAIRFNHRGRSHAARFES